MAYVVLFVRSRGWPAKFLHCDGYDSVFLATEALPLHSFSFHLLHCVLKRVPYRLWMLHSVHGVNRIDSLNEASSDIYTLLMRYDLHPAKVALRYHTGLPVDGQPVPKRVPSKVPLMLNLPSFQAPLLRVQPTFCCKSLQKQNSSSYSVIEMARFWAEYPTETVASPLVPNKSFHLSLLTLRIVLLYGYLPPMRVHLLLL